MLKAFRLVLSDDNVEAVLVNIFAGINRCDWVAEGVVQALQQLEPMVPVVVRLSGTNVEEGRRILAEAGVGVVTADSLAEAGVRAVRPSGRERGLMSIILNETTPVLVQGITGRIATFHTTEMLEYGTKWWVASRRAGAAAPTAACRSSTP